jgi:hypothetical protein
MTNHYTHARPDSEDVCVAALDNLFPRSSPVAPGPENRIERLLTHDSGPVEEAPETEEEAV